jgi:ribosome-associated protein
VNDNTLYITNGIAIPLDELRFRYARSSGPGGQHVQKTETKVELLFDLANSPSLTGEQRARALERLANRIDNEGVLHLTSQGGRSQMQNRQEVLERLQALLAAALKPRKRRRATQPSLEARRRRVESKRQRSQLKRLRGRVPPE